MAAGLPARLLRAAATALAVLAAASVAADPAEQRPPDGWRAWTPPGKTPAYFAADEAGGLAVASDGGVTFLIRPVTAAEAAQPRLAWRWRVEAAPPPTDLARRGGDDRALAVHVWFPDDPDRTPSVASLIAAAAARLIGQPPPLPGDGYTLSYVWGGDAATGTRVVNPYMERAMMIVRRGRDAPIDQWLAEDVDLAEDFRIAFAAPPPSPPAFLAISTDTDATGSRAAASIDGPAFTAAAPGR